MVGVPWRVVTIVMQSVESFAHPYAGCAYDYQLRDGVVVMPARRLFSFATLQWEQAACTFESWNGAPLSSRDWMWSPWVASWVQPGSRSWHW